jgi:hypothetical protein
MSDDEVEPKYLTKSVWTIRGLEARTRAKWEKQGWEFVTQNQSLLRTELSFRRVKKKLPWYAWAAIGAGVVLLGVGITVGSLTEAPTASHDAPQPPPAAVSTPDTQATEIPVATQTAAPVAPALDETYAAQYLAMQWEAKFTYGGTVHWIESRITTANPDGSFTFKIDATVKNAYGTDEDATIEGDVSGTDAAPIITDSILYTDDGTVVNFSG